MSLNPFRQGRLKLGAPSRVRKMVASVAALAVVAGVPVTFAILHDGFPVSDVKLNVKDVWVTNNADALAGRLNRQIDELTAGAQTESNDIDVVQDGAQVYLHDLQLGTLERVARARANLVQKTRMPDNAEIALGHTTLTVLDPRNGKLWIVDVANGLTFDMDSTKPDVTLGAGGRATVSRSGKVYAISPQKGKLYEFDRAAALPKVSALKSTAGSQLSVVGETPVILSADGSTLTTGDGKSTKLPATGIRLQQASEQSADALVATADSLLSVPLGGAAPTAIEANVAAAGTVTAQDVSAPVRLDGCDYGAWAQSQRYLQQCDGKAATRLTIEQATAGSTLEFRVNQHVIALNNLQNGNTWVLSSKLKLVNNWDEVRPPQESKTTKGHTKTTQESFEDTLAHRTAVNHPPIARDDSYGVRPGRTTILPVLNNDTDQDGDVLVITSTSDISKSFGTIDQIDGGRALQFTPAGSASGVRTFSYNVSDGRSLPVEASVTLTMVAPSVNHAPTKVRDGHVSVEAGQSISYNVLTDWIDPDGDDIELKAATPTSADTVRFTPDGFITFQHKSGQLGNKTVNFVVTDGTATAAGKLIVDVKAAGALTPVGTPDFAQIFQGGTTVIQPLQNDLSPSGRPLALGAIAGIPSSATVTPNADTGSISVSSSTVGTIYLTYKVTAGDEQGEGIIRVDVLPTPDQDLPPIAVKDVGYVRAGQSTTVKVMANDVSPEGKVLSVQSVDTDHTDQNLKVELLNNTNVRLTAPSGLTTQTQFTYTISDGEHTSVAGVTVVPVPPIVNRQPPVAVDDKATVRAGDIASVSVLANDYHPDQEQMHVEPQLVDTTQDGGGLAFVTGDKVRYEAPTKPGQYSVIYRVADQYGESATAKVTFTVTSLDAKNDRPPVPVTQTARTFAGQAVRIDVPLDGLDPDGDSVFLTGIVTPPGLGSITQPGPTWFEYTPDRDSSGTDTFTYKVSDTYGMSGTGTINIGVIQHSDLHAQPNAVDDTIEVRPGKTIAAPVLDNDSDPNAYRLTLSKKLTNVSPSLKAHVSGSKVIVTAPNKKGQFALRYSISNGQGGVDSAFLNVKVTPSAKLLYPTAQDDFLTTQQLKGSSAVKVNILPLIDNPNGEDSSLLISAEGPNAERADIDQNAGTISVQPGDSRYAVAYRVTDPNTKTLSATAFIVVPPLADKDKTANIQLKTTLPRQIVKMNSSRTWNLSAILDVPSGRSATLTSANDIHASHTDGTSPYVDKNTLKFVAQKDYRGPASMVFQVTDGTQTNYVTMPITVGDPNNEDVPPTFTRLKTQIQAGEAATVVNLRDSTGHPNRSLISQFTYDGLKGQTASIAASIGGANLSISAPIGVQPGATAKLTFTVHYKDFKVPGEVDVTVVKSTRPLAQAEPDAAKGQRNVPISLNVLSNDFNPYDDLGKPLKLIDAKVTNGAVANVAFTSDGVVTVSQEDVGAVNIDYTVRDASNDPTRDVHGQYILTVRDVPSQPSPPTIVSEQDGSVTIGWQAPATNGEPILDYTITTSGGIGTSMARADQAQATISGLTNGSNYTFQISARNALGDSTISSASATAVPFGKPGAPGGASISASSTGNGALSLTWGAANGNGRSVTGYSVTLSDGQTKNVSGLSTTFTGKVGTAYTFSVVANNPAGSGAATTSNSATPRPGAPSSATTSVGGPGDSTVTMTWGAAASNVAISRYEISINGGGWATATSPHTFAGSFGTAYSFQVRAVSGGQTSDVTGSNSATPQAPLAASATIVGKGPNSTCSDGGSGCKAAIVRLDNIIAGTYTVSIQEMNSQGTVVFTGSAKRCAASSGSTCTSGGILGLLPAGDTMRVHIYNGPSGDFYSNTLDRAGWQAAG